MLCTNIVFANFTENIKEMDIILNSLNMICLSILQGKDIESIKKI